MKKTWSTQPQRHILHKGKRKRTRKYQDTIKEAEIDPISSDDLAKIDENSPKDVKEDEDLEEAKAE